MFGLFRKKTEKEKLQQQYKNLMKEAYELSKLNRSLSDSKYAEADKLQKQIEALSANP